MSNTGPRVRPFTDTEIRSIVTAYEGGASPYAISRQVGRSEYLIREQLKKQGFKLSNGARYAAAKAAPPPPPPPRYAFPTHDRSGITLAGRDWRAA